MEKNNNTLKPLNSPFGRVYLCPQTEQIINCAIGLNNPINLNSLKTAFSNTLILNHPRFSSLMVIDRNGVENWKKTRVHLDDHIVIHHHHHNPNHINSPLEDEAAINAYIADISVSTPLSKEKPLWEVHLLMGLKCVVFRVHHALGDGASIMCFLSSCFGEKISDHGKNVGGKIDDHGEKRSWKEKNVWGFLKSLWFTLVFGLRLLGRVLWVNDKLSVISGGDGVELWPRLLVTSKFKLQDFKFVKNALPSATINDVLLGVISCGLSKYLQIKSPKDMLHGLEFTGIVVVNLRNGPPLQEKSDQIGTISWGNKTGMVLQPIYCQGGLNPLDHVRIMKAIMDQKKQSYEAHLPYVSLKLLASFFGPKVASWVTYRILCNTTMLISNIMGPSEKLVIGDNPVTFLRVNISSQPHAITMHMVSYGENLDVQMMVAKDIIHDPQFLANCFEDSLIEMKNCVALNGNLNFIRP